MPKQLSLSVAVFVLLCLAASGQTELHVYHPLLTLHQEPTLARVGNLLEHIPTAVSHQSSTIVHRTAPRLTPLLAPALRTTLHYPPTWSYPFYEATNSLYRK
ncbi:retinin [Drosophila obscura]|uniref:retinin n=1 Tax=Drosophila obscura TaxID=7282 RepID=UPI001BB0EEF2|nr:retinin [Drosophila obscura]